MSTTPQPAEQTGGGMSVLKILGIIFLVLVLLCGGLGVWVAMNFRNWSAAAIQTVVVQVIEQSNLPAEQKDSIRENVDSLTDDFKAGRISVGDLGMVFTRLMEGPFPNLIIVEGLRYEHERLVKVDDDERASITRLFDRFERGIVEETFTQSEIDQVLSAVTVTDAGGTKTPKQNLTSEDLKAFVEAMKAPAEEAQIPDEPFQVDFAGMIDDATKGIISSPDGSDEPTESKPATRPAAPTTRPAASQPA